MKNHKGLPILFFIAIFMVFIASCNQEKREIKSPYPSDYFIKEIWKLKNADVASDVDASISKGDCRFLVCIGWGPIAPGIAQDDPKIKKYGTRILDGTGDMIFGEDHKRYKKAAADYASRYNTLLLERILEAEKKKQEYSGTISDNK
jgi:hypothetical protein